MAWVTNKSGKTYFYLSKRIGGRVHKQYLGNGVLAAVEAHRLEQRRRVLEQIKRESSLTEEAEASLREHCSTTKDLVASLMACAGYSNVRSRGWRKTNMDTHENDPSKEVCEIPEKSVYELIHAARNGDASAVGPLRRALLENPELMRANGEVACRTQVYWVDLIAGTDLYRRECLLISMGKLKHELLAETNGTVAERMLVQLAISTWLQVFYHEQKEALDPAGNIALGEFRLKKIESSFSRYMRTMSALSALKAVRFTQRMADAMTAVAAQEADGRSGTEIERRAHKPVNRLEAVCRN